MKSLFEKYKELSEGMTQEEFDWYRWFMVQEKTVRTGQVTIVES